MGTVARLLLSFIAVAGFGALVWIFGCVFEVLQAGWEVMRND